MEQKLPPSRSPKPLPYELARDPILGTAQAAIAVNQSPVHVRRLVRAGKFPPPLKIGDRKLGWRTSTITRYIETRENIANSTLT
jgi:predicted DNA-binding transcriptional regulator AlpA